MAGAWHLRLWRRTQLVPGVRVNLSKSGPSVSIGPRGAHVTVGTRGVRETVGIPGTGLYATRTVRGEAEPSTAGAEAAPHDGTLPPVPWLATTILVTVITAALAIANPSQASVILADGLLVLPVALVAAWLFRRHPAALAALLVGIVGLFVVALAAGASGSTRRRRR